MKKLPKPLLALCIGVFTVAILFIIISLFPEKQEDEDIEENNNNAVAEQQQNTPDRVEQPYEARVADVDPIEIPEDVAGDVGFEPKVTDRLTERFVLRSVEKGDNSIIYYYQTHVRTDGERLMLICNQMSSSDYESSLPEKGAEDLTYNDITLTYAEKTLLYVPNDYVPPEAIQKYIDSGDMIVQYGNRMDEMIPMQSLCWYDGGIKYELRVWYNNITKDELFEMAKLIINS